MDRSTCDGRNMDGETAQSVLPLRRKRSNRRHEPRPARDASAALPERQARHSALIKTSLGQVQGRSRKSLGQVSDESKASVREVFQIYLDLSETCFDLFETCFDSGSIDSELID